VGEFASKTRLLLAAWLLLPTLAWSAGLGKLSVGSTLGQPLQAEIEIVSLQRGEGDSLTGRLAPVDAFRQANVELNPALLTVKFAVERRPSGQYVMTLRSAQPINEPFLDLLVELSWANGRLVREYTFLLDPPEYRGPPQQTKPVEAAPAPLAVLPGPVAPGARETPANTAPPVPDSPPDSRAARTETGTPAPFPTVVLPGSPPIDPAGAPVDTVTTAAADQAPTVAVPVEPIREPSVPLSYEVRRGDTLSKIAMRNRVEGVTLQQMLVALFRANQAAFAADNMNRLYAGKIINIPDKESLEPVSTADARRIVSAQYADFNEYKRTLGIAVASRPASPEGGRRVSGRIGTPAEEKPAPSKEPAKDQLRLSKAD
jgi:pilus assembly protein FimV